MMIVSLPPVSVPISDPESAGPPVSAIASDTLGPGSETPGRSGYTVGPSTPVSLGSGPDTFDAVQPNRIIEQMRDCPDFSKNAALPTHMSVD